MGEIFGRIFFGRIFWGEFFVYIVKVSHGLLYKQMSMGQLSYLNMKYERGLMFLSRFWGNARRKEEFRSLEVRGKLIALKNRLRSHDNIYLFQLILCCSSCIWPKSMMLCSISKYERSFSTILHT